MIFSRALSRRKSDNVYTDSCKNKLVDDLYYSTKADDFVAIFDLAKIVRKDIMEERQWKFRGSFSGFEVPKSLSTLLEWILVGPKTSYSDNSVKKTAIDSCINNIAQIVMRATKSRKQVTQSADSSFRDTIETPFAVGLGILVHVETRNKKMIQLTLI